MATPTTTTAFTMSAKLIKWAGDKLVTSPNLSGYESEGDKVILNAKGVPAFTLMKNTETIWPNHTINGITTSSFQDFSDKFDLAAGVVSVEVKDKTNAPIDFFFSKINGVPTTIAAETVIDAYAVVVASATGCSVGDWFGMFNADDPTANRYSFATILSISDNTLTLDTPIDFAFQVGDTAACFNRNLASDGSATPQIFSIQVGEHATQSIHINRIMLSMETAGAVSLDKFGDLTRLARGMVLRRVNGEVRTVWNVKSNGEIANLCFDYDPHSASNPNQGQNGANFRYTFNGEDKHGVTILLEPGDELQLIVQDDISGITKLTAIGEGHLK